MESVQRVARVVKDEEHRYATTFQVAEKVFHDEAKAAAGGVLPGAVGVQALRHLRPGARRAGGDGARARPGHRPRRLRARDGAAARARPRQLEGRREGADRARSTRSCSSRAAREFLGYDDARSRVAAWSALIVDQQPVETRRAGREAELVLDQTPFYAEAGGQVGDQRRALLARDRRDGRRGARPPIPPSPGLTVHRIVDAGAASAPATSCAPRSTRALRRATMRNHTATHLLHAALRQVLGTHVKQAGSVVEPGRLRFDFTHYTAMDRAELDEVERLVNEQILRNTAVAHRRHGPRPGARHRRHGAVRREVRREGARGLACPASAASCAAARTSRRTGDIGVCKIVYEGSISAGVRRIEAITGEGALAPLPGDRRIARAASSQMVRASEPELLEQVEKLLGAAEGARTAGRAAEGQGGAGASWASSRAQARDDQGRARCWPARVDGMDRAADARRWPIRCATSGRRAVVVLASAEDGNVAIVSAVTKDLTAQGARRQTGGRRGAGRRRQGRRPSRHGRSRRQGCRGARPRRSTSVYASVEANAVSRVVRRRRRRRGAHRARLRHRTEAARAARPS